MQCSSSKIVTSEAVQRVTDETLQSESHLKFGKSLVPRTNFNEAQNFLIQKKEKHRIMEDRKSFQKQKPQRSSFKITTSERFQMVNNDALELVMSSRATAWHHITGCTPRVFTS